MSCIPTGVKHLHHKAMDFDIVVFFEANGHETVVFSESAKIIIREKGGEKLSTLLDVVNQTVGDAISDLLLVEFVLADRGWNCKDWNQVLQGPAQKAGEGQDPGDHHGC